MSAVHPVELLVLGHHIVGIHRQAKTGGSLEFVAAEESIRQIGRSEDDLYPTSKIWSADKLHKVHDHLRYT